MFIKKRVAILTKNFGHPGPKISSNHATAVATIRPASGTHLHFIEALHACASHHDFTA
ncbi:hypothetical protein [Rickettsiella massiliensis]|uniref:hypothetical protein n=1 Tax=Rickettsiella massiliensis TaxID=676517 RepID=UPI00178C2281|nr:hypothetical protein [Rickettsiella massiliensis]